MINVTLECSEASMVILINGTREEPLEEGMATHSSIRAQRIPRTEGPEVLCPLGSKESDTTEAI